MNKITIELESNDSNQISLNKQFADALYNDANAPWIKITHPGNKHDGTIGRAFPKDSRDFNTPRTYFVQRSYWYTNYPSQSCRHLTLIMDDGTKIKYGTYKRSFEWLTDYRGPSVLTEVDPKAAKLYDSLGTEISVDSHCSFMSYNTLMLGKIVGFGANGSVKIRNHQLAGKTSQQEFNIRDLKNVIVLSDDILNKMMMKKLSL